MRAVLCLVGLVGLGMPATAQHLRLAEQSRDEYELPIQAAAVGDLDGDGIEDLVASILPLEFTADPGRIAVLAGGSLIGDVHTADLPQGLVLSDLDGDGDLDVAVAQQGGTASPVEVYINLGGVQGDSPGRLRPAGLALAPLWQARQVLAVDADARPETPDDLLLVRFGFPPLLLRNLTQPGEDPRFAPWQSFDFELRAAAAVIDANGDGREDLFMATPCTLAIQQGVDAEPPYVLHDVPACAGLGEGVGESIAAEILSTAPWRIGIALGTSHAVHWLHQEGPGPADFVLGPALPGSGAVVLIDADGDGLRDLVAAGFESTVIADSGRVFRRLSATLFDANPLQHLPGAADARLRMTSEGERLFLARRFGVSAHYAWAAMAPQATVGFDTRLHHGPPGRIPMPLIAEYVGADPVSAQVHVQFPSGGSSTRTFELPAYASALPQPYMRDLGAAIGEFNLTIVALSPPAGPGTLPQSTVVRTVPAEPEPQLCYFEMLQQWTGFWPSRPSGVEGSGAIAELALLRRLRDEQLRATPGGQHQVALYESLQAELWQASFRSSTFIDRLREVKEAWMPAMQSLVDGDGTALITPPMVTLLDGVLDEFEVHGSEALRSAIAREREALGLRTLSGQPVSEFRRRWEAARVHADGFE